MKRMIINTVKKNDENVIAIRSRDRNGNRQTKYHTCFPYFYTRADVNVPNSITTFGRPNTIYQEPTTLRSLDGRALLKCSYENPSARHNIVKYLHNLGITTYQGDVDASRLFCVDEDLKVPEYDLRKWYFDIETQVGGEHHEKITVLSI